MTTIALKDDVMAADSGVSDRGLFIGEAEKIAEHPEHGLLGVCGDLGDMHNFHKWFKNGADLDNMPPLNDESSECLWAHPDGTVRWIGHSTGSKSYVVAVEHPWHAAGVGFRTAIGAMAAGASAERALDICVDIDAYTRGPVQVCALPHTNRKVKPHIVAGGKIQRSKIRAAVKSVIQTKSKTERMGEGKGLVGEIVQGEKEKSMA